MDVIFVPASPLLGNVAQDYDPEKMSAVGDAGQEAVSVRIFGEVRAPGSFSHKQGADFVDYLMRAGGVTRFANIEQIRVISGGEPFFFSLKAYFDTGDESLLPALEGGSVILVPKQEIAIKAGPKTVYAMGEVAAPGAFDTQDNVNLLDVLANAGGPTRFADTRQNPHLK